MLFRDGQIMEKKLWIFFSPFFGQNFSTSLNVEQKWRPLGFPKLAMFLVYKTKTMGWFGNRFRFNSKLVELVRGESRGLAVPLLMS